MILKMVLFIMFIIVTIKEYQLNQNMMVHLTCNVPAPTRQHLDCSGIVAVLYADWRQCVAYMDN